jgi:gas vesicle protein
MIGASLGAIVGLLLAPRPGKETRKQIFGERLDPGKQPNRWYEATDGNSDMSDERAQELKRKIDETRERLRRQAGISDD